MINSSNAKQFHYDHAKQFHTMISSNAKQFHYDQ